METVSILIPAYNAEKFLPRCVESILKQTYEALEIILVNDGSKDFTLKKCRYYQAIDNRIKVIDQENQGVAAARNTALDNAGGDFILFVDADDWIEPDMVEIMIEASHSVKDCDIVFCTHDFAECPEDVNRKSDTHDKEVWNQYKQQLEFMKHRRMTGMLWNKLIRRSLFEVIRFDPTVGYGEDAQALWKVLKQSSNMIVLDETLYHHVLEKSSISHRSYSSKKFSSVKVWNEIEADVVQNYPQWIHLAEERQLENSTWLSYEMRRSDYRNKEEKIVMRNVVRKNLKAVFRKNDISAKMRMYAVVVALGM